MTMGLLTPGETPVSLRESSFPFKVKSLKVDFKESMKLSKKSEREGKMRSNFSIKIV